MKTTQNAVSSQDEKTTVVPGRSSTDNRGTDLGLSSTCERAETALPDSVELHEVDGGVA